MKAISLWQPWATLWVLRIKKEETRHYEFWKWHAGPVAIHAAKKRIKRIDGNKTKAVQENPQR